VKIEGAARHINEKKKNRIKVEERNIATKIQDGTQNPPPPPLKPLNLQHLTKESRTWISRYNSSNMQANVCIKKRRN